MDVSELTFDDAENSDFWVDLSTDDIGTAILDRCSRFDEAMDRNGQRATWTKMHRFYYGRFRSEWESDTQGLGTAGENNEFVFLSPNQFRSLGKQIYNATVQNPPRFEVRAVNTDTRSIQLAYVGNSLMENYSRELQPKLMKAVEHSLIYNNGFVHVEWDITRGERYGQVADLDTNTLLSAGDLRITNPTAFQVVYDAAKANWEEHDWIIVREWVSRSDLYKQYRDVPDLQDRIKAATSREHTTGRYTRNFGIGATVPEGLNDDILVFKFYHKRTPTRLDGRMTVCLEDGTVLLDLDFLPYNRLPVFRLAAAEEEGTTHGYSPLNDALAIQEALNLINSTIISNQAAFGSNIIALPKGSDINPEALRGLRFVDVNFQAGEPRALQLCATPAELFRYRDTLINEMETILGVSDVSRGRNLSGSSGANNALMVSITAQNSGPFQGNYANFCGDVGTFMIRLLEFHVQNPRTIAIIGNNGPSSSTFTGQDLAGIDRVYVDLGNPMAASPQGRMMMAQQLLQINAITPQEYFEVLTSGNIASAFDSHQQELIYLESENDVLRRGGAITVDPLYDNHMMHLAKHRELLQKPEVRFDTSPQGLALLQSIHTHMIQHEQAMAQAQAQNRPPPPQMPVQGKPPGSRGTQNAPQEKGQGGHPGIGDQAANGRNLPAPAQPAQPR